MNTIFMLIFAHLALFFGVLFLVGCGEGRFTPALPFEDPGDCSHLAPNVQAGASEQDYAAFAACRRHLDI